LKLPRTSTFWKRGEKVPVVQGQKAYQLADEPIPTTDKAAERAGELRKLAANFVAFFLPGF